MTVLVASDALVAGEVRVVRLESALGPCVQGLHEKREKVPHPGLQHVSGQCATPTARCAVAAGKCIM